MSFASDVARASARAKERGRGRKEKEGERGIIGGGGSWPTFRFTGCRPIFRGTANEEDESLEPPSIISLRSTGLTVPL